MNNISPDSVKSYIISSLGDDYIEDNSELRYQCPFCRDAGHTYQDYKFYVNFRNKPGVYWCHRCESTGRIHLNELLVQPSVSDVSDPLERLIYSLGSSKIENDSDDSDYYLLPKKVPELGTAAYDYLIGRGISDADIKFYNIRVGTSLDQNKKFAGRVVVPNRVISNIWTDFFVARTYTGSSIRYYNPPNSKSHDLVFNLHNIPDNPEYIIINEGVFNSIIAGELSVATFGKYVSNKQLASIVKKHPKRLYVSLDSDARDEALKLCNRISSLASCDIKLVELPDGLDAADLGRSAYYDYLSSAVPYHNQTVFNLSSYLANLPSNEQL